MDYKKLHREIKKSLDNLDNIKISNTLKSEAILEAIKPLLNEDQPIVDRKPLIRLRNTYDSN